MWIHRADATNTVEDTAASECDTVSSSAGIKRKVEEDPDTDNLPPAKTQKSFTKHETHWNLDGSLLLQTGNTRFKVHRSRLTSESPWFSALIDKRSGLSCEDTYENDPQIDQVLSTVEDVEGIDLFFLGSESAGFPGAEAFSILLTAMNRGM